MTGYDMVFSGEEDGDGGGGVDEADGGDKGDEGGDAVQST